MTKVKVYKHETDRPAFGKCHLNNFIWLTIFSNNLIQRQNR